VICTVVLIDVAIGGVMKDSYSPSYAKPAYYEETYTTTYAPATYTVMWFTSFAFN